MDASSSYVASFVSPKGTYNHHNSLAKESFVVDNDCRISALTERSATLRNLSPFSGQRLLEDLKEEYERVDLTNEPAPAEESEFKMIFG